MTRAIIKNKDIDTKISEGYKPRLILSDEKVKPEEWYALSHIVKLGLFPWAKSFKTVRKIVENDAERGNILKATITGEGLGKKYYFKGENIIKFLKSIETGKARL